MNNIGKIGYVVLSVLILWSTTGMTLHKHYCMGQLQEVTAYQKAKSCMEKMGLEKPCPVGCCETTSEELKVEDLTKLDVSFEFKPYLSTAVEVESFIYDVNVPDEPTYPRYLNYKPPLLDRDVPILVQSFLI